MTVNNAVYGMLIICASYFKNQFYGLILCNVLLNRLQQTEKEPVSTLKSWKYFKALKIVVQAI